MTAPQPNQTQADQPQEETFAYNSYDNQLTREQLGEAIRTEGA